MNIKFYVPKEEVIPTRLRLMVDRKQVDYKRVDNEFAYDFQFYDTEAALEFAKTKKELIVFSGKRTSVNLNQKQLLAIAKQMEELGWFDEKMEVEE